MGPFTQIKSIGYEMHVQKIRIWRIEINLDLLGYLRHLSESMIFPEFGYSSPPR